MTAPARPKRIIETLGRVAPLGIRFHDALTDTDVHGLTVDAWPALGDATVEQSLRRIRAFETAGAVYGWLDLPGLRQYTFGAGDDKYWRDLPRVFKYRVEVADAARRFLPFRFDVQAPARGILTWAGDPADSPPNASRAVPLHSAPSRIPPAATAVMRADIREAESLRAASWAVVIAHSGGRRIGRGMADENGRLLLLAHYPEPVPQPIAVSASPPRAPQVPLWNQEWPVELEVFYGARKADTEIDPPDLTEALRQPPALVWRDDGRRAALGTVVLKYGEELLLRTTGEGARRALLVTRTDGGSPP
jgi:hypothetical protein